MDEPEWSEVGPEHNMTKMMRSLVDGHDQLCAEAKVSPWDFCVMLANVQGIILGQSKDMPIAHGLQRIEDLKKVVTLRLHEERATSIGNA